MYCVLSLGSPRYSAPLQMQSYAWSSCSSVAWAVLLAALTLFVTTPSLNVGTGDFESTIPPQWTVSSNGLLPVALAAVDVAALFAHGWFVSGTLAMACQQSAPASYSQCGGSDSALPYGSTAPFCFVESGLALAYTGTHSLRVAVAYANMTPAAVSWVSTLHLAFLAHSIPRSRTVAPLSTRGSASS